MTVLGLNITTAEPTTDWTGLCSSHPRRPCHHRFATIVDGDERYSECRWCGKQVYTIYDTGNLYQMECTCTPNSDACPTCRAAHEAQEIPY